MWPVRCMQITITITLPYTHTQYRAIKLLYSWMSTSSSILPLWMFLLDQNVLKIIHVHCSDSHEEQTELIYSVFSCIAIQPKCTTSVLPLIPAGSRVVVLFSPQRRLYRHQISNLRSRSTPLFCFELISTIYSYYRKKKHSALKLCTIWSRWKKQSCIYTQ